MKVIKFVFATEVNYGSETEPNIKLLLTNSSYPYSEENLEKAKQESYNGEITIEDDGQPEPEPSESEQLRSDVNELQEALNLILSGVTE